MTTTATDASQDWLLLLDAVDRLNPGYVDQQSLHRATGLPFARFEQALLWADRMNALQRSIGSFSLSGSGHHLLDKARAEAADAAARSEKAGAEIARPDVPPEVRPAFERYRQAAVDALPAFNEQRRQLQHDAQIQRDFAATQAWGSVLGFFQALPTFKADWECFVERRLTPWRRPATSIRKSWR